MQKITHSLVNIWYDLQEIGGFENFHNNILITTWIKTDSPKWNSNYLIFIMFLLRFNKNMINYNKIIGIFNNMKTKIFLKDHNSFIFIKFYIYFLYFLVFDFWNIQCYHKVTHKFINYLNIKIPERGRLNVIKTHRISIKKFQSTFLTDICCSTIPHTFIFCHLVSTLKAIINISSIVYY